MGLDVAEEVLSMSREPELRSGRFDRAVAQVPRLVEPAEQFSVQGLTPERITDVGRNARAR